MSGNPLTALSIELADLVDRLTRFADRSDPGETQDVADLAPSAKVRTALRLYQERRARDTLVGAALFGEPTWDMLLDLYARQQLGRPTSITDACLAAAAPQSTALRHLKRMLAEGLLVREIDSADARRSWIRLSAPLLTRLDAYIARIATERTT